MVRLSSYLIVSHLILDKVTYILSFSINVFIPRPTSSLRIILNLRTKILAAHVLQKIYLNL